MKEEIQKQVAVNLEHLRLYILFNIETDANGCWLWKNALNTYGYAWMHWGGRTVTGHLASYLAFVGFIPKGLHLDHLCRVHRCCNPEHLEPVTNRENIRRGINQVAINAKKTECKWGHAFTPENTIVSTSSKYPKRHCRQCSRDKSRKAYPTHQ